jgi:hypothetical protein
MQHIKIVGRRTDKRLGISYGEFKNGECCLQKCERYRFGVFVDRP